MLLVECEPGSVEVLRVTTCVPAQVPSQQQIFAPSDVVRREMNPLETAIVFVPDNVVAHFIIFVQQLMYCRGK